MLIFMWRMKLFCPELFLCVDNSSAVSLQAAIKGLTMGGLEIISITDNSPVPHNGCRPRKARRV